MKLILDVMSSDPDVSIDVSDVSNVSNVLDVHDANVTVRMKLTNDIVI